MLFVYSFFVSCSPIIIQYRMHFFGTSNVQRINE